MSEQVQVAGIVGGVKQLVNLLQYQDRSIVSRVLLKNKGGTVTSRQSFNIVVNYRIYYTLDIYPAAA
ncbi:MAG TPA: hypothetical protein VJ124_22890 [Pyrinomonadaceae bacterium]|nr:hypothetical protein [Pyrinomonadaceae bacterium]